ncbi:hypothetical protein ACIO3O_22205 [Streptomyces sp. NPDC087440]|uniref:hypothetical protein n=1 Tax=Streptomyces sp. NPDC087440 TaxID=3365790 RepID=UPI0037F1AFE7
MPFDPYAALNAMIRAEVRRSSDTGPSPIARRTTEPVSRPSVERRAASHQATERARGEHHPAAERSEPVRRTAPKSGRDKS